MGVGGGRFETAVFEPAGHHGNFVFLGKRNALGEGFHGLAVTAVIHQDAHLHGLTVMRDHALHESHVGFGKLQSGEIGRLFGADLAARLSRQAGLNDGNLGYGRNADGQGQGGEQETECHRFISNVDCA